MYMLFLAQNPCILARDIQAGVLSYITQSSWYMHIIFLTLRIAAMSPDIYLDANATSAVLPAAIDAADEVMRASYGNPSSTHASGLRAKAVLDGARACARRVLGVGAGRLMFTSGATEGIQTAVLSALVAVRERRARGEATGDLLLYGATEHKAVPEALAHWNRVLGAGLTLCALPVDGAGQPQLGMLRELAPRAALVCTMAANNETGVITDLAAIDAVLRECAPDAYWMVDSVQALGKLALALADTRIDYAPFSGHKLYAPKGVGMLYVREGAPYTPLMMGGGQEGGQRAGTENMAGIAALGAVLAALEQGGTFRTHEQLAAMRERLAGALRLALPGIVFNAPFASALPTTLNFAVPGLSGKDLLDLFDAGGMRVSAGSACSSAKSAPSYVLEAMGRPAWACGAAVRMSFGPLADDAFIDAACARIARCGDALRVSGMLPSSLRGDAALPSPLLPAVADGVLQLSADGACGWLVQDGASRSCVLVDVPVAQAGRVAALVASHALRVRAVLATGAAHMAGRAALLAALGIQADAASAANIAANTAAHTSANTTAYLAADLAADCDALGWPHQQRAIRLADGSSADALIVGLQMVARLPLGEGAAYLVGDGGAGGLPTGVVRIAFAGAALQPAAAALAGSHAANGANDAASDGANDGACEGASARRLAAVIQRDTVLCCAHGEAELFCTTLGAQARVRLAPMAPALDLDGVRRLLREHPDAILVDVREDFEHAAAGTAAWMGQAAQSVPLSRLAGALPGWLGGARAPLVFFCRSGNRSARAVQCLQRLGYAPAFHLSGGMALAGGR